MEDHRFLTPELARRIAREHGTPCYVYDQGALEAQADAMLAFPNAFGLTVRFAMKACPNAALLRIFLAKGLHFDASSGWEVRRAMVAGVPADRISLSSQELPEDFVELLRQGVHVNACSLLQLERIGQALPGHEVGLRFNPGRGSGGTGKTNVGGPDSSFGIWHEWADQAQAIVKQHGLKVVRIHTHIGSGSDPAVWQEVSAASLALVGRFPTVAVLNLGGGYKVARVPSEKGTDPAVVGAPVLEAFERFARTDGRRLRLEVEPGTFLVANAGAVLAKVQDVVSTGAREFIKLDSGMTEILRPSLYGSQHPVHLYPAAARGGERDYVVVGHCCESGDLISCAPGEPETLATRRLPAAAAGDLCVIGGAGAYCAGMSTKNYNSFPEAPEALIGRDGGVKLIRRRQTLGQILQNEVPRGRLTVPLRQPALCEAVPPSPHATVLCLPTLDDVIAYERKDPRVWSLIRAGYPRFVRNELVTLAAEELADRVGLAPEWGPPDLRDVPRTLFPLARADIAERLAAQAGARILSYGFNPGFTLIVVESGDAATRLAKLVQHTGTLISSRQAEAWLAGAPAVPDTGSPAVRAALAPFFPGVQPDDLLLCSSGMNAVDAALHAVDSVQAPAGRRVWIQLGWLYVDSIRLLEKNPGVERRFVHDVTDLAAVERHLAAGDVAGVLTEAPNNPQLQTADLEALRALCDRHGALLVVDPSSAGVAATDTLPWADVVACSLTKYAASAGDVMAGVLAVNPARSHAARLLGAARARHVPLHPLDAAALAPQAARVAEVTAKLSANAAELARRLAAHPAVVRVRTALTGPTADNYRRVMRAGMGAGSLVTVELREGAMRGVYDRLALVKGPSFGLGFTIVAPFMWLAHFEEVTSEQGRAAIRAAGLDPDLLRVSVGLEPVDEIWAAFERALA